MTGLVHSNQSMVDKKLLFALVCECLKYREILQELVEKAGIKEKQLQKSKGMLHLLCYDLLFGKGIKNGAGQLKPLLLGYKSRLNGELVKIMVKRGIRNKADLIPEHIRNQIIIPRWVRVNTLKTTMKETITHFQESGLQLLSPNEFDSAIQAKEFPIKAFLQDKHLPNMLVLPPNTDLHKDSFMLEGKIILQDKASCFPAYILNPPSGSTVIDGCAAPGNKTSHLYMIMGNTGKIFAFDMDRKRLDTLERLTGRAGCTNIHPTHGSFLEINPKDEKYKNVQYILLDPSCSGSGIVGRMDHLTKDITSSSPPISQEEQEETPETEEERVEALAEFQQSVLLHAFSFPNVKKVVYSTCSKHDLENELVVQSVLKQSRNWRLAKDIFPQWPRRGREIIKGNKHVIRTLPEEDKTIGFFVALFEKFDNPFPLK